MLHMHGWRPRDSFASADSMPADDDVAVRPQLLDTNVCVLVTVKKQVLKDGHDG